MVNPNWGKKRVCAGCSVRYYDLRSQLPVCPKCGTAAEVMTFSKSRRRTAEANIVDIDVFDGIDGADESVAGEIEVVLEDDFDDDLRISVDASDEM
ncbi:MAG: TIGR02300 family protein [Holosporales bacterium]|nr:TIGR02300 family protein [Holosporales bacterium]